MALAAGIPASITYVGSGTADDFSFPFPFWEDSDVEAHVIGDGATTELVLNTDYTLSGNNRGAGAGNLSLIDAGQAWLDGDGDLATGYSLRIRFKFNPRQTARFRDLGPHAPVEFEKALDQVNMQLIAIEALMGDIGTFLDIAYTPQGPEEIAAGGEITVTALLRQHLKIVGVAASGEQDLSNTPFGTDPDLFVNGMEIVVEGTDDDDYLQFVEADVQYGFIGNGDIKMRKGVIATFIYNSIDERFYLKGTGAW